VQSFTSIACDFSNLLQKLRCFFDVRKAHAKHVDFIQQSVERSAAEEQNFVADESGDEHAQYANVLAPPRGINRRIFAAAHAVLHVSANGFRRYSQQPQTNSRTFKTKMTRIQYTKSGR
jgi:U3 small nucleolar RNA-associated protein 14